jgi:HlyD family secretion protein
MRTKDRIDMKLVLRRTRLVGGVAAAVLAAIAVVLLLRPPAVTVAEVVVRDLAPVVHGVGTVEAKVVLQIGAKIAGRLSGVLVDQGDTVQPGQVLARLDDAQLAAEVRRAQAAVETIAAQLADLEAGTRREEIDEARAGVVRAQAQLDDLLAGARTQELGELRERLGSASATRVLAERDLARVSELHRRDLVAAQELDRARQAFDVATAQERAARQSLDLAIAGPRGHQVESARAQLEATRGRLAFLEAGPRPHQVAAQRAQLRETRAALALARERQRDAVVTSPIAGLVVSRDLEPGVTVSAGTPIVKLADPATAWVTVHVDERDTGMLGPGDRAEIALRSRPGQALPARVVRVRRESDRVTEQLAVDVTFVETSPGRLTLGEQAEARILPAGRRAVPAAPLAAVVRRPEGAGMLTVDRDRVRFRPVRLGVTDAHGWVEVLEGPRTGELVVLAPGRLASAASEGRRVRVVSRTSGAAQASEAR